VLCNALCFLTHRLGKSAVKCLKSSVLDFYRVEELSDAKKRLLQDVNNLNVGLDMPHVPERRDCELRAVRIVDDIFTVLTFLDENLKLQLLPKYVADGPDSMPSTRLYEGDLSILMKHIDIISGRLSDLDVKVAAIMNDVQSLQVRGEVRSTVTSLGKGSTRTESAGVGPQPQRPTAGVTHVNIRTTADQSADCRDTGTEDDQSLRPLLQSQDWPSVAVSSPVAAADSDWPALASSSTFTHANRFAALGTTDDEHNDVPFTEHHSRHSTKRRRQRSAAQQQQQPQDLGRQHSGKLLMGKSTSTGGHLTAAKKIIKRAVFCVDNVDPAYDVDNVRAFVSSLSITVLSCFAAVPRRRHNESLPIVDRKAFRLCIADADRERLLDDSKWPDSVTISEWYHIPASEDRRQRAIANAQANTTSAAGVVNVPATREERSTTSEVSTNLAASSVNIAAAAAVVTSSPIATDMVVDAVDEPSGADDGDDRTIVYHHGS